MASDDVEIWHNPRCSKSRATLALLKERGISPKIRLYLEDPPSTAELDTVLVALGQAPRDLIRRGESEYKELGLDDPKLDRDALIAAMHENPRLIERPVVLKDGKARVGRPPEAVLEILK